MAQDPYDHARMTSLVMEEKAAKEAFVEAKQDIGKWKKRHQMALNAADIGLADTAGRKVAELEETMAKARFDLERIQQDKSMLRMEANLPQETHNTAQAEALIEDFRALGASPEEGELRELAIEQSAEDMLAALKTRMND